MIIGHTLGAFLSQDPTDWHGVHIVSLSFGDCPGLDRQLAQLARLTVWGRASRLRSEIVAQRVLSRGTPTSVGNITRSAIRSDRLDVTDPGIQTQAGLRPRKVCSIP